MGTSSIFNGRNDRNSLLPEDYEPTNEEQKNYSDPVKWQTVKSDMSKHIKSGGTYSSKRHIAQQYVKAMGGARRMTLQSYSGRKAGANIGNFFNRIVINGIELTFESLGVQYVGKSVEEIFSRLVDVIAPNSNTKEDIIAKEATQMALSRVYDYVEANDMDIKCINNMTSESMNGVLKEYVSSYIWITMMNDLGSRLEMYITDSNDAYATECEFKDMIFGIVDVEFDKQGNIINQDVSSTINNLYERCLGVLEGII